MIPPIQQLAAAAWTDVTTLAGALFYAVLFLLGALLLARFVRAAAENLIRHDSHKHLDPAVVLFLADLVRVALFVAALVLYAHLIPALRSLGTALLAGVSVVSIIAGIAAQGTFGNLIAGITLLLYRPFRAGDRICVFVPTGAECGVVERITLGNTLLMTDDQRRVVVPNSLLCAQVVVNMTSRVPQPVVAQINVPVEPESIAAARELLLALAADHAHTQEPIGCHVVHLDRNGAVLQLTATCHDALDVQQVASDLYVGIPASLTKAGVAIAAPQMMPR